jgi:hypothetical protein
MPDEMRPNRPMASRPDMMSGHMPMEQHSGRRGSKMPWGILALVVIVLVILGVVFRDKLFANNADAAMASGYQAVFLTNGQVYFGKTAYSGGNYLKLTDIFYLQVDQPVQGSQQDQQQAQAQPKLTLVKLGKELHGPLDEMYINRDQVLFYEDMSKTAQVVQKILEYKKNPNGTPAATSSQQAPAAAQTQQAPVTTTPAPTK